MKRRVPESLKIFAAVLYVGSLLVLFELACRSFIPTMSFINRFGFNDNASWRIRWVLQHEAGTNDPEQIDQYHDVVGWTLKPNLRDATYYGDKSLNSNSQGIRGKKEYTFWRNEKTRIVVFGDSYTFGEEVADEETYSHILGELLPGTEVLNFGVRGFGHDQMLLYFKEEGVKYKPDVAVFAFLGIDQDRNLVKFRSFAKPRFYVRDGELELSNVPIPTPEEILASDPPSLRIVDLISNIGARIYQKSGFERFEKNKVSAAIMDDFILHAQAVGAEPVFLYLPADHEVDPGKKTKGEKFFEMYCDSRAVKHINLRPYFVDAYEAGVDLGEGHWNVNGHRIVAEHLRVFLIKEGLIQPIRI